MRTSIKFALILLISVINVKVKARSVELPQNCRTQERACTVYADELIENLSLASATAIFSKGSTVTRSADGSVKIIRGLARISARSETKINTLYGEIKLNDGEVLVEVVDSVVRFTNLSSQSLYYHPRGEDRDHNLPIGFSTYMAKITKSGVAEAGYPHPAEIEQLLKRWAKVYPRSEKARFQSAVNSFMLSWNQATQLVGPWYLDTVQREIASAEAEKERIARLKAQREAESRSLRELFRKRIFDP